MARPLYVDTEASGVAVFLGPTEAQLMELVWKHGALTVKQTQALLIGRHALAYTTIMTVLSRLANKGLLARRRQSRTYIYSPAVDRETFLADRIAQLTGCLKRNFPGQF